MQSALDRAEQNLYQLRQWRFDELRRAGYPPDMAAVLAERGQLDLHIACALLERGATLEQALGILL
jgi:hypothetical protein